MAISMLKIRRPLGRLIFNMGIAIPGKTVFLIETAPRLLTSCLTAICYVTLTCHPRLQALHSCMQYIMWYCCIRIYFLVISPVRSPYREKGEIVILAAIT